MVKSNSVSGKAAIVTVVALVFIALFLLIWHNASFFLIVFGGVLFAVLLSTLAHALSDTTKIAYSISLVIVTLLFFGIIGGTFWYLAPTISQQADELAKTLPQALERIKENLSQTGWGQRLLEGLPTRSGQFVSSDTGILTRLTGIFSSTLGILANIIIIIVTGIYLAANPGNYRKGFLKLIIPGYRDRMNEVLLKCYHTLGNWLLSRSITMVVVGILTGTGLALLGVPLPFVLAIIAGVLNFIPNIGPYLALLPAVLLAYLQGPNQAIYVILLYFGIQSLEGYILTPLLDKKFVSMPPALLLFGQVLLGILVGIGGIILASPIIAVLLVLVKELYIKDYLEKKSTTPNTSL